MSLIVTVVIAALLIWLLVKLIALPIKWGFKLLLNALGGFLLLFVGNFLGSWIGISVTVSWLSAIVVGLLGVPGFILLAVVSLFV